MGTYYELYFEGSSEEIEKFINLMNSMAKDPWSFTMSNDPDGINTAYFKRKDGISIAIGIRSDAIADGCLCVENIISHKTAESTLTVEQYNIYLKEFYEELVKPFIDSSGYKGIGESFRIRFDKGYVNTLEGMDYYDEAMTVFIEMQKVAKDWNDKSKSVKIAELLAGKNIWERMKKGVHQQIGKLIAHHWPEFAAMCNIPIYAVYDHTDKNDQGVYRIVYNHKEDV